MEKSRSTVIVVDDDTTNLTIAKNVLTERYDTFTAPSGKKLFQILEKLTPDLIVLDLEMPELNGYEVIERLKNNPVTSQIPVIFLTAVIDPEAEVKGLSLGATDYITKPFSRELLLKRIERHLLVEEQNRKLVDYSHNLERMVKQKTKAVFDLQRSIVKTVAELVEFRDSITGGHIERTQNYLSLLVDFLLEHEIFSEELMRWDMEMFISSSQLHDIGKIHIRDDILMKPDKLTEDEFTEMKKHAVYGMDIVAKIEAGIPENAFLRHARILAGSHHEKWCGSGYPLGLKGKEIPLEGRLMAIVDVYDALTNDRPYKKAFTHEEAISTIKEGIGNHFDPVLADIFIQHEQEFKNITNRKKINVHPYMDGSSWQPVPNSSAPTDIVRRYLTVLIDALLARDSYKKEVSSWDIDLFLLSAQLHEKRESRANSNLDETPLQDKLLAIVDVYDALTGGSSDRKRKSHSEAVEMIKHGSGKQFDPDLVSIFLEYEKEFANLSSAPGNIPA